MFHITNEIQNTGVQWVSALKGLLLGSSEGGDSKLDTLHTACREGRTSIVAALLDEDFERALEKDVNGCDLQDVVCDSADVEMQQQLIDRMPDRETILLHRAESLLMRVLARGSIELYDSQCSYAGFVPTQQQFECFLQTLAEADLFQQFRRLLLASNYEVDLHYVFHVACRNNSLSIVSYLRHHEQITICMDTWHSICEGGAVAVLDVLAPQQPTDDASVKILIGSNTLHNRVEIQVRLLDHLGVVLHPEYQLHAWSTACESRRILMCTEIWLYLIENEPTIVPLVQAQLIQTALHAHIQPVLACLRPQVAADAHKYLWEAIQYQQHYTIQYILQLAYPDDELVEHSLLYYVHRRSIVISTNPSASVTVNSTADTHRTQKTIISLAESHTTTNLLHTALVLKDPTLVQLLVYLQANIFSLDDTFLTPLHSAVLNERTNEDSLITQSLQQHPDVSKISQFTMHNQTLLMFMIMHAKSSYYVEQILHLALAEQ